MNLYNILSNHKCYNVIVGNYLVYLCIYFVMMSATSLGKHEGWVQCKHMHHMDYKPQCIVSKMNSSFIIPLRIETRFNVCWYVIKHVRDNDNIIKICLHQFSCVFHLHYS
jgi:competence transcription factor ComK